MFTETTIKLLFVPVWVTFPKSSHRGNAAFNEHISIRSNYPAGSSRKTSQHTKHSAVQLPKQSIALSVTPQHKQGAIFYMSHGLQGLLLAMKRSVSTSSGLLHQRSRYLKCNSFTQAFCWLHLPWLLLFGALVLFFLANTPTYYTLVQVADFDTCKVNSFQGNQHRSSVQVHTNRVGLPRTSWGVKSLTWLSPLQLFLALRPVAAPSLLPLAPPLLGSSGQSSWWA